MSAAAAAAAASVVDVQKGFTRLKQRRKERREKGDEAEAAMARENLRKPVLAVCGRVL
jgi:hypothetical protein